MTDALAEFLANTSPSEVERERLAPLKAARRNSFGHRSHKAMLAVHEAEHVKFAAHQARHDERAAGVRVTAMTREANERLARKQHTFTDTQLAVAMAALNGKK